MSGKAADLDSLLRLRRWGVDERRRELGVLLSREQELIAEANGLDHQLLAEQEVAAADATGVGFAYGAYAEDNRRRHEMVMRNLALLAGEIAAARERLAESYRDLKVMEEVRKTRRREEEIEEARKEQALYDEIGQTQFRQRQT